MRMLRNRKYFDFLNQHDNLKISNVGPEYGVKVRIQT